MRLSLRNGTFGTSSADCDVIRAKFFRFFRGFWVRIASSFQEVQKKEGSFLDSEFLIEIRLTTLVQSLFLKSLTVFFSFAEHEDITNGVPKPRLTTFNPEETHSWETIAE